MPTPPTQISSPSGGPPRRPTRWWPVWIILSLAVGATIWVRTSYGRHRQDQNIATANILIISLLLLLLWCLLLSRWRWKIRLGVFATVIALVALMPLLFRIHGVTGDLVPILEWRWTHHSSLALKARAQPARAGAFSQPASDGGDYPQFLGPNRNATVSSPKLARDWKAQPPQRFWRQAVGPAWSGFAVAGNLAITQEQRGEEEAVVCYDSRSGAMVWSHGDQAHYQSSIAGEGPRATPTIAGDRVFTVGSTGILNCLDRATGKLIWSKNIVQDNQSHVNEWGMSCSPLVLGDLVVVSAGGGDNRSLVAYRTTTGEFVWGGGNDGEGYSSPRLVTLATVPQVLIFNSGGVSSHHAADGKVLWKYPWPGGHPHVAMPVLLPEDRLLVSSGYGVGSELLQVNKDADGKFNATRIWKSNRLKTKFTNVVYHQGFIYGLDDGIMVCIAASNGDLKWKEGRYGHGQEILVADLLLVMAESGEVILLEPDSGQSRELGRFSALDGKTWNPPALAGELLLVRNDKEAACYRLPVAKQANGVKLAAAAP